MANKKSATPFGNNKTIVSTSKLGSRFDWYRDGFDKQVNFLETNYNAGTVVVGPEGCSAVAGGNGEDNDVGYVVNRTIDNGNNIHNSAYFECDYVE